MLENKNKTQHKDKGEGPGQRLTPARLRLFRRSRTFCFALPSKGQQRPASHICVDCRGYFDSSLSSVAEGVHSSHTVTLIEEEEAILKEWSASCGMKSVSE